MKKKVTAPLSYDPGKGRPKEHLAYLNWQEMQQLQRLNGGNMERGPRGLPSFPPADARGSSSRSSSSPSRSSGGGGGRDSGQAASRSSGSYGGGGRDTGGRGNVGMGKAPGSSRASSGSYGGGGRDTGGKGNVGMGRAPSAAKAPSYGGGGRDTGRAAPKPSSAATSGVRSISRVTPSYSPPRAALQAVRRGAGSISGTMLGNNDPVAQTRSLQAITNAVNERYGTSYSPSQISEFSRAIAGEAAGEDRFGRAAVANTMFNRISLAQEDPKKYGYMGGTSPEKLMSKYDATGLREGTKPNSAYKSAVPGTPSFQAGLTAIADAVSPLSEFSQTATPRVLNATHYYNPKDANPKWGARSGREFQQVGGHLFGNDEQSEKAVSSVRSKVSQPASAMNAPPKFMTAEQKMADVKNTLYSPRALGSLYKDIGTYGITDREKRSLAQQQLLGQTIGASQYGGAVTATLNPNLTGKGTIDPFSRDVAMHWTGDNEPVERISGLGYAVTIDDRGNINYTRPFEPSGEIRRTSHMKGLNDRYIGISSQGVEPNESQLRAASALGQNWFNPSAVATTHGYEAGTRVLRGERDLPGEFRKQPAEGVALAGAFTGTPMSAGDFRPSMIAARDAVAVPAGAPAKVPSTGYPGGRPVPAESSVAAVAPSQIGGAEFQPYGMTVEQEEKVKKTMKPAKTAIKVGAGLVGTVAPGAGLAGRPLAGAYEKNVEKRLNAYVAASPSERAAMEAKDPAIIGWARTIGVQPQNDYSVYQSWAAERGLRGAGESRGEQQGDQGDVRYAGGIGSLPSASVPLSTQPSTPSTAAPSGPRPYQYYQWDVGVNIPSPTDPSYTSYQEYLRRRAQAQA